MRPLVLKSLLAGLLACSLTPGAALAQTTVTALLDGQPSLLGWDQGYQSGAGSHVVTLSDSELEYLSTDYALAIDLFNDGLIRFYDNSGSGSMAGATLNLDFAGLGTAITGIALQDLSQLGSGTVSATLLSPSSVIISFGALSFTSDAFPSFDLQLTLAPVPEPASIALFAAGLVGLAALRRRQRGQA